MPEAALRNPFFLLQTHGRLNSRSAAPLPLSIHLELHMASGNGALLLSSRPEGFPYRKGTLGKHVSLPKGYGP